PGERVGVRASVPIKTNTASYSADLMGFNHKTHSASEVATKANGRKRTQRGEAVTKGTRLCAKHQPKHSASKVDHG
ncbi:MAG: hypothetical protein KIS67_10125, partial [Verrucomicrobiae bacterium]|nr:hypothetical protein [Verrucomicrobiae bacterium]